MKDQRVDLHQRRGCGPSATTIRSARPERAAGGGGGGRRDRAASASRRGRHARVRPAPAPLPATATPDVPRAPDGRAPRAGERPRGPARPLRRRRARPAGKAARAPPREACLQRAAPPRGAPAAPPSAARRARREREETPADPPPASRRRRESCARPRGRPSVYERPARLTSALPRKSGSLGFLDEHGERRVRLVPCASSRRSRSRPAALRIPARGGRGSRTTPPPMVASGE